MWHAFFKLFQWNLSSFLKKTELYKQVRLSFSGSHIYMQIIVEQSETIVHRPLGLQATISLLYSRTIMITLSQSPN